jgi:tRNA modification GTPase
LTGPEQQPVGVVRIEDEGRDELAEAIFSRLGFESEGGAGDHIAVSARHQQSLQRAAEMLEAGSGRLQAGESPEFIALELRAALDALGEIVGRTDVEEILGEIFASFCIGK